MIKIIEASSNSQDAVLLMDELSKQLEMITGNDGRGSYHPDDFCKARAFYAIAYDCEDNPVGCGGIRPLIEDIAELKRMYSKIRNQGVGTEILFYIEKKAKEMGYKSIWLETRAVNEAAISFYEVNGYLRIDNYGKYKDNPEAVCLGKIL